MKKYSFFSILFCLVFALIAISCEKADLQKSLKDDSRINPRITECAECPDNDCCCDVELVSGNNISLILCGTSSPDVTTTSCGTYNVGSCTISGFELPITFVNPHDKRLFCMPINAGFSITSSGSTVLKVSCQHGQTSPWYQYVTIGANETAYLTNNGSCQVGFCEH